MSMSRVIFDLKSIKAQLIIFLFCFALFCAIKERSPLFLRPMVIAVISALVFEGMFSYFRNKLFQISESALITGLIVGSVLASDQAWWLIVLACLAAIFSKYFLSIRKKHFFNPAAFGVLFAIILFGAQTQWSGTYLWYVLIPFGFYFIYKIRKIEVILGYLVVSFLLFGAQALWHKVSLWSIFGYFSYFFIFIMIIEPRTSPVKKLQKYLFGSGVALLIFILTEAGVSFDIELASLLIMNATVPLFSRLYLEREARR